jgi:hypothetical protein
MVEALLTLFTAIQEQLGLKLEPSKSRRKTTNGAAQSQPIGPVTIKIKNIHLPTSTSQRISPTRKSHPPPPSLSVKSGKKDFPKEEVHKMSQRQIDANSINGAKGGVKTWAGKQISKMNAERHGFTSKKLVLTTEEEPQFNEMMQG